MVSTAQAGEAPTQAVNAAALRLEHEAVPADQSVANSPTTGSAPVGEFKGLEVGVWEMSVGTMTDVEVDEVFVVISGRATVIIAGQDEPLNLVAGDVVTLRTGMETEWTVTETLRKVYLA